MCAPSSPAPSSQAVPDWASAMLTQTSSTDKENSETTKRLRTQKRASLQYHSLYSFQPV
eukprot:CAMPEP_0203848210 /NCGR_PEP_ID=MMETSP0359-20131031/5463_1 /ASSEMBLY_ACC=CAM_ASM_000338 /TAXON_ID=268821 /ORGANISM="Scrippsiella Hangoei, Strain SHTV-5" /LENGTH=58 /DNA_ID=CAMNT_0050763775 /DNA_START=39 /DNA_END=215 /DNA_ORIENTATION=-